VRAAVYHGRCDLRVEDRPAPVAAPGEVLVRVSVTGVCGTDAAEYHTGPHLYWIGHTRHPHSGQHGPLIPGHEFVGRVEALGPEVRGFREGDLVASGAGVSCGRCRACWSGRMNLCEQYWTVGLQRDGGLAELVAVPAATCVAVEPYGLTEDAAALAQPMAIAAHAVDRGLPGPGDEVLVIGAGGIGGLIAYAAARFGPTVVVCEADPGRREIAGRLGAAVVLAPPEPDVSDLPASDVVFEVSGSPGGLASALRAVRRGGRIVVVGMQEPPSAVDLRAMALDEIALIGTVAHRCTEDLPAALRLLADRSEGWADIAPTAIPLEAVVEDALIPLWTRTSQRIKTLVDPRIRAARPTVMGAAPTTPAVQAAP
jgi:(R,R)-butanediol dehydrogenase/meso-butanediol dehydrogenase/diacetyl reductase